MTEPTTYAKIADLKSGERIIGFFMIVKAALETFRDPSKGKYLSLTLADKTGQVNAKVWEGGPELYDTFGGPDNAVGRVIKLQADVREFNEKLDLVILKARLANEDEYTLADFLPTTNSNIDDLWRVVTEARQKINHPALSALVNGFYDNPEFVAAFEKAPVTTQVHHAYIGGALEQTAEMVQIADTLLYLYPLDRNVLRAAVLLANVGKVRENKVTTALEKTDEGELLGGIVLDLLAVQTAISQIADFPAELAGHILHILAAQNGRLEYGSPRRPQSLEAMALAQIKETTVKMAQYAAIDANAKGQTWTSRNDVLGLALYVPARDTAATFPAAAEAEA